MGKHRKISPGDVIEHLEILENLGYRKYCGNNTTYWKCRCTRCGSIIEVPQKNLGKAQKDCGCGRSSPKAKIKPGDKFGRLKVIDIGKLIPGRGYTYLCECKCEEHKRLYVRGDLLRSGETRSCGCIHDNVAKKNLKKAHAQNYVNGTSINKILENDLQKNNTSGVRGVSWHKKTGKWLARINYKGKTYQLGYYSDIKEAGAAVDAARKHIKDDFAEWYSAEYPKKWREVKEKIPEIKPQRFDELIRNTKLHDSQVRLLELVESEKKQSDIAREKGHSRQSVNNSLEIIAKKAGYDNWKAVLEAFPPLEEKERENKGEKERENKRYALNERAERFLKYDFSDLPERQRVFAEMISEGESNKKIGSIMGMSPGMVTAWVKYMEKAVYADEAGILHISPIKTVEGNSYSHEELKKLTNRQMQVYELYAKGFSYKEISEQLGVDPSYITHIMKVVQKKLNTDMK